MSETLAGYRISTRNDAARTAWNTFLEALMAHAATAPDHLAEALARDPNLAVGHATKGLLLLALARAELLPAAMTCLGTARAAAMAEPVLPEEQAVIDALAAWLEARPRDAATVLETALALNPRDVLALKLAQMIRFMLGHAGEMLTATRLATRQLDLTRPLAGFILGCHAFALEETGHYTEAEKTGRMAVSLAPRDVWGRHAVAHVLEMTGRTRDGLEWLGDRELWAHANNLRFHVAWHMALFHLERGETGEVLALYDREIRAEKTGDYRDIANGASLLARLELAGIPVGDRWEELAEHAESRLDDRRLVFAELHYVLALLGAGNIHAAEMLAGHLAQDQQKHPDPDRRRAAICGSWATRGLIAFKQGQFDEAADALGEALSRQAAIGGSHAQRDILEQAYLESLVQSEQHGRARSLLNQRLLRRGGVNSFATQRLRRIASTPRRQNAATLVGLTGLRMAH